MSATSARRDVFVTGATGFVGRALCAELLRRGQRVRGLAREGSQRRLAPGVEPVIGDALRRETFEGRIEPGDTLVHLVGATHPAPWKAEEFRSIDLASLAASLAAARAAGVRHFVFVSVAQPAPIMRAYVAVRAECEQRIRASGLPATILRPWYVLGPGRRWPLLLAPFYAVAERLPWTRDGAERLGLVSAGQMAAALAGVVEDPPQGVRVLDVPAIRTAGRSALTPR